MAGMPRIPAPRPTGTVGTLARWDHCGPWPVYAHSDLVGASGRALKLENQTESKQPTFPVPALAGSSYWKGKWLEVGDWGKAPGEGVDDDGRILAD